MSDRLRLAAGALTLDLAPAVGGSIAHFDQEDRPLMRPAPDAYEDVLQAACFPLVPFSNRVRNGRFRFGDRDVSLSPNLPPQRHPLHGVAWRGAWQVAEHGPAHAILSFRSPGGEWPWPFKAQQRFALDERGLAVALSVTNTADEPMPAGLGLHPYFPCPPGTTLDASVEAVWTVDVDLFPVERQAAEGRYSLRERDVAGAGLDNGYDGWTGAATIRWPDGRGLRITAEPPARWFQVYAPEGEPVLCAEPVTHANGALNAPEAEQAALGLHVLQPGETLTLAARFDPLA